MSIIIGGDLVPYGNERHYKENNINELLGSELSTIWNKADYRFFNLECPITSLGKEIGKSGPHLRCQPLAVKGIKGLCPSCVMLANNHILDYGESGLIDTIKILDANNVNWIGVGTKMGALVKTYSFVDHGKRILIYNCCEHEFSVATETTAGANPYDELNIFDEIQKLKDKNDYVIIVYHGGKEYYRYPSPLLQKRCRKMVESGADMVICQHSHCIGAEERYKGGTILYGQGNFIFNRKNDEYWGTSLLLKLDLTQSMPISYIPIVQTGTGVRLASEQESKKILDDFRHRSSEIKDDGFVRKEYKKYAITQLDRYMLMVRKKNLYFRVMYKILPNLVNKNLYNYFSLLNVVECESHSELFIEGLKEKIK